MLNLQKRTEEIIEKEQGQQKRPRLVLHCCCAPCASYPLIWLSPTFDIIALYDNPNIESQEEYDKRATELIRLVKSYPFTHRPQVVIAPYEPDVFEQAVKQRKKDAEGGKRCSICFALRLERAARYAKKEKADYLTTTLSISPHKDAKRLYNIVKHAAHRHQLQDLASDFKKKNGFLVSSKISQTYGLYRQDYCGCIYSRQERKLR